MKHSSNSSPRRSRRPIPRDRLVRTAV